MANTLADMISGIIVFLFIYSFVKAYNDPNKHITIGEYLTNFDQPAKKSKIQAVNNAPVATNVAKPKKITKPKPERKENPSKELKEDCNAAMKSIGVDSKQRKYLMTTVFSKYNPKTVEEFLRQAFA